MFAGATIVFDLDGTLVDTAPDRFRSRPSAAASATAPGS
jgi:phosphoglycolate phosphatase-like HAD superfamily hydrolase